MADLGIAVRIVEGMMVFLAVLLLGTYLRRGIGGRRLATGIGIIALVTVVVLTINAAIMLG